MMLIVIPNIIGKIVQRSIVRIGLLASDDFKMLCYKMARHWMQPKPKHGAQSQVHQSLQAEIIPNSHVESNSEYPVENFIFNDLFWSCEKWSEGVRDPAEEQKNGFCKGAGHVSPLIVAWDINVPLVGALERVVLQVVSLESPEKSNADAKVHKVAEILVLPSLWEPEIMGQLVACENHTVVQEPAHEIRAEYHNHPISAAHEIGHQDLHSDCRESKNRRNGIWFVQFLDLRVFLDNFSSPQNMRFGFLRIREILGFVSAPVHGVVRTLVSV